MANVKELNINSTTYDIIGKGVVDQNNASTPLKQWTGTKAQYDAIVSKDANTLYNITDDTNPTQALLETMYPVGSIYIGTMSTCPLAALFGTWTLVASDRVLQGAGNRGSVGTTLSESLPNHTHSGTTSTNGVHGHNIYQWNQNNQNYTAQCWDSNGTSPHTANGGGVHPSGHLSWQSSSFKTAGDMVFSGSGDISGVTDSRANHSHTITTGGASSATYQDDAHVQQNAYLVNIWERTA